MLVGASSRASECRASLLADGRAQPRVFTLAVARRSGTDRMNEESMREIERIWTHKGREKLVTMKRKIHRWDSNEKDFCIFACSYRNRRTRAAHAEDSYLFAAGSRAPAAQRGRHRRNCRPITTHRYLPHKVMACAQAYVRGNLPRCGEAAPIPCSAAGAHKE